MKDAGVVGAAQREPGFTSWVEGLRVSTCHPEIAGRLLPTFAACSNMCANRSRSKSARYRPTSCGRDPVSPFPPGDVVAHLHAGNLFGPVERGVKWGHLVYGTDQEFVLLLKNAHALHDVGL